MPLSGLDIIVKGRTDAVKQIPSAFFFEGMLALSDKRHNVCETWIVLSAAKMVYKILQSVFAEVQLLQAALKWMSETASDCLKGFTHQPRHCHAIRGFQEQEAKCLRITTTKLAGAVRSSALVMWPRHSVQASHTLMIPFPLSDSRSNGPEDRI